MSILNRFSAWLNWLKADPAGFLIFLVYFALSILLTLILHEIAHGWVAYRCGDPTAKMLGRLSLDPRKHLDPAGTVCLILFGFGWARPVPVNPRNYRDPRHDDILVSIAGITVNMTLYLLSTTLAVGLNRCLWQPDVIAFYGAKELLSSNGVGYAVLVGGYGGQYTSLMRAPWLMYVQRFLLMFSGMNLSIGLFNLLPIPPLDGYHLFNDILLKGRLRLNFNAFRVAQTVLILLCLTGTLSGLLTGAVDAVEDAVLNLLLRITGMR